jgi:hypothetical protein
MERGRAARTGVVAAGEPSSRHGVVSRDIGLSGITGAHLVRSGGPGRRAVREWRPGRAPRDRDRRSLTNVTE